MRDEDRRIHWLRLDSPKNVSQLLEKDSGGQIAWKAQRTGRIGFRFRCDQSMACIEVYEEFSYKINTSLKDLKVPQLQVDDAREVRIIGTLFPGLDPEDGEKGQMIREIAEEAADNNITDQGLFDFLYRIMLWAVNHDHNLMDATKERFPDWVDGAKEAIEKAKQ